MLFNKRENVSVDLWCKIYCCVFMDFMIVGCEVSKYELKRISLNDELIPLPPPNPSICTLFKAVSRVSPHLAILYLDEFGYEILLYPSYQLFWWFKLLQIWCHKRDKFLLSLRLYLGYHTASQCGYGVLVGSLFALVWCGIVQQILTPLFPVIVSW